MGGIEVVGHHAPAPRFPLARACAEPYKLQEAEPTPVPSLAESFRIYSGSTAIINFEIGVAITA